jgi:thioredoxin-related protein
MKKIALLALIICTLALNRGFSQQTIATDKIQWISFKEALEKNKKEPKKIIMDINTEWCGWCKYMDRTTFTDPNIIAYINTNYYAVKFDAESFDTIEYKGKKYGPSQPYSGSGRKPSHNLAISLLQGQLSYPNIMYFDDSSNVITAIPGYKSAKDLQAFLLYFAENIYKYANIQPFLNDFNNTFTDSLKEKTEKVKWLTIKQALEKNKKEKRKIIISLQTDWCPTCKIMDNSTFNNAKLSEYINTKCYPVRLNATTKDTIEYNNYKFINENKEHPFNQFAVTLLNGKMRFPNFIFIDENLNIITSIPGYMTTDGIEPIIKFFVTDSFKTIKWEDYLKTFTSDLSK